MIKQFNFYDIYGYLLPGILLIGLFWLPIGVLTQAWPDQDLSKALFLSVLAYIAGHILQSIAISFVPSTVRDRNNRQRFPSDLLLDKGDSRFGEKVKEQLATHVLDLFGIALEVKQDWDGKGDLSKNRNDAFFQARSYLIAKQAARYAEQFEGLYAMMRGLGCSFFCGAVYIAGWALSFHRNSFRISSWMPIVLGLTLAVALISASIAFFEEAARKKADHFLAWSLIVALLGSGFEAGVWRFQTIGEPAPAYAEPILWCSVLLTWIAAARCFSAYKSFALEFAKTIWRDFAANLALQPTNTPSKADDCD